MVFWITFDLSLACNLSNLGLAAGINHIYPSYITAGITSYYKNNCNCSSIS